MPDPEMSRHAEFKLGKCVPDMALYHNDESHFDLLVKDDSRLALLGLLAGTGVEDPEIVKEGVKISESNDEWTKVNYKRRNGKEENFDKEELLEEVENNTKNTTNLEEEVELLTANIMDIKEQVHRMFLRIDPRPK